jgi:hypothetical protein
MFLFLISYMRDDNPMVIKSVLQYFLVRVPVAVILVKNRSLFGKETEVGL